LKDRPTSGSDQIPSYLVRDCRHAFVKPLLKICNLVLSTATFPDVWKISKLCPVSKGGDISDIVNYRPIAILPNFAKVLEMVLYTRILL
jgi:hypothetical protein